MLQVIGNRRALIRSETRQSYSTTHNETGVGGIIHLIRIGSAIGHQTREPETKKSRSGISVLKRKKKSCICICSITGIMMKHIGHIIDAIIIIVNIIFIR